MPWRTPMLTVPPILRRLSSPARATCSSSPCSRDRRHRVNDHITQQDRIDGSVAESAPARTFVISDAHGYPELITAALEHGGFRPGTDAFVYAGDFVDRGPDVQGCLEVIETQATEVLVGNHEHLGRLALDDVQTALDIRSPIDEVARVDEGIGAGAEAAVLQGRGDEFRVAVGIGDDERAGRSGLRHRTVDPVLLCDVVVHSVSSIAGTRRAGACRPRRRDLPRRPPWSRRAGRSRDRHRPAPRASRRRAPRTY